MLIFTMIANLISKTHKSMLPLNTEKKISETSQLDSFYIKIYIVILNYKCTF